MKHEHSQPTVVLSSDGSGSVSDSLIGWTSSGDVTVEPEFLHIGTGENRTTINLKTGHMECRIATIAPGVVDE